jgi:hypothetical protein
VQRRPIPRLAVVGASVAGALLASVRDVAADTGPLPTDVTVESGRFPTELAIGALIVAAVAVAVLVPPARRWIAAGGILAATGLGLFAIMIVGTIGGWSGKPMEPWTIPAMVAVGVAGVASAGLVVLRHRPR